MFKLDKKYYSIIVILSLIVIFIFTAIIIGKTPITLSDKDLSKDHVEKEGESILSMSGNVYRSGNDFVVSKVSGDVYIFSKTLKIVKSLVGDIGFVGEKLTVDEVVYGDVRSLSETTSISDDVEGEILFLGESLVIERDSVVKGDIIAFASSVIVNGVVEGDIKMNGDKLSIYGNVHGNVNAKEVNNIIIHSNGSVGGGITFTEYSEKTLIVEDGAVVEKLNPLVEEKESKSFFSHIGELFFLIFAGLIAYAMLKGDWAKFIAMPLKKTLISPLIGILFIISLLVGIFILLVIPSLLFFSIIISLVFLLVIFLGIVATPVIVGAGLQWLYIKKIEVTLQSTLIGVLSLFLLSSFTSLMPVVVSLSTLFFIGICVQKIVSSEKVNVRVKKILNINK